MPNSMWSIIIILCAILWTIYVVYTITRTVLWLVKWKKSQGKMSEKRELRKSWEEQNKGYK